MARKSQEGGWSRGNFDRRDTSTITLVASTNLKSKCDYKTLGDAGVGKEEGRIYKEATGPKGTATQWKSSGRRKSHGGLPKQGGSLKREKEVS